ncbi:MAG: ABC transporter permease, partial [Promethearchaeota archaeon]
MGRSRVCCEFVMFQKFNFNIRQAIYNVKRSFMTILTLTIAISMVAGLFFYFDAFEREAAQSTSQFSTFSDLNLLHSSSTRQLECSNTFQFTDAGVYISLDNAQLEVEAAYKYQTISSTSYPPFLGSFVFVDHSSRPDLLSQGLNSFEYFRFHSFQLDNNFYQSKRFTQFFNMIEGRTPQNKNEILIDMMVAAKFDYDVGSSVNLTTVNFYDYGDQYTIIIPNMTVVGTFVPTTSLQSYRIVNGSTDFSNYYFDFTEEDFIGLDYNDLYELDSSGTDTPLLGFSTFEADDHPFQQYYQTLVPLVVGEILTLDYFSGYGVTLNRDIVSFFNINPPARTVEIGINDLVRSLPYSIIILDMISTPLQALFEQSNRMRILSQLINIPVILVALIVGSFTSKSSAQSKLDEFLLLRSKGVPNRTVRNQILMESIVNGIVASVFGTGLGFVTFFGHDLWIRPMIYTQFIELDVKLFVKVSSILLSIGIGVFLSFFTSFSSIRYVNRQKTSDLLTTIDQKDMDVEFDEQSVYRSLDKTTKTMRKSNREIKKEYRDIIEEKRKKTKKWSIFFLFIGALPVYYYFFIKYAFEIFPNSLLQNWKYFSENFLVYSFLSLVFIIAPVFLGIAFIRIITQEAPIILGRISRFFGRMFLGYKSYLLGLQMIKKKQYATVIMFLGIFSALFVHMNIMTYSLFAQKNVYTNYQTGADMSVSFEFGFNLTNTGDFEDLIQDVKAIAPNGEPLVEDAMVIYQHPHRFISKQYMYYVNFSHYLNFVSDKDKILPNRDFVATINALNDYNLNDPERDIYPGAIVNQKYLENNNVEVGNITYLAYEYYDSTQPFHTAFDNGYIIAVRIVGIAEYLPGVYVRPLSEESAEASVESIAVDAS